MEPGARTVIAVPSETAEGLGAARSEHFGRSPYFILVELLGNVVGDVVTIENSPHGERGCGGPVRLLFDAGVTDVVVAGVGARPLAALLDADVRVYRDATTGTVGGAVNALIDGALERVAPEGDCGCGH
jgi:predicted Fe-Mo cluster-binding NifX family protein